jgi:hypothetical protein
MDENERLIRKAAFEEANEFLQENAELGKELYGDIQPLTREVLDLAINRLLDYDYDVEASSEAERERKLGIFSRLDAALLLRDFVYDEPLLSSRYPKHLLWYHIGVFRAFIHGKDAVELFESPDRRKPPPSAAAERVVQEALPEIEEIWAAIKKIGVSERSGDKEEAWREEALRRFNDSKKGWEWVKREYLEEGRLYAWNPGQGQRDFWSALLRRIVADKTGEKCGGQGLYRLAKRMKKGGEASTN